jgi:DNA-binding winged helix-turn-helix (wHTH) protein
VDGAIVPTRGQPDVPASRCVRFGSYEADLLAREIRRNGIRIHLHHQPFEVLADLLEHPGEVVTREQLRQKLWADDTFVDFEHGLNKAINKVREALGDSADNPRFIETLPRRGYRFVAPVSAISLAPVPTSPLPESSLQTDPAASVLTPQPAAVHITRTRSYRYAWLALAGAVILVAVWMLVARRSAFWPHHSAPSTEKHTAVLADFVNSTGDPVFDETLRQGLAVQLEQSPYLSLIADERVRQTLRLMERPADARIDPQTAYEICRRIQSAVAVDGSIAALGSQYVVGLKAVDCRTGQSVADAQERAESKEQVLAALDQAAVKLRKRLGESDQSLQRFDTPLAEATTPSLEALQAYSPGAAESRPRDGGFILQTGNRVGSEICVGLRRVGSRLREQLATHIGCRLRSKRLRAANGSKRTRAVVYRSRVFHPRDSGHGEGTRCIRALDPDLSAKPGTPSERLRDL